MEEGVKGKLRKGMLAKCVRTRQCAAKSFTFDQNSLRWMCAWAGAFFIIFNVSKTINGRSETRLAGRRPVLAHAPTSRVRLIQ